MADDRLGCQWNDDYTSVVDQPKSDIGTDLVGAGKIGVQLIQTGEKFLEKLLGPYLEERGQMMADRVKAKRRANLVTVAGLASEQIGDQSVGPIPGRILFPLLEAAANEDAPELQKLWAALLTQTALRPESITPAFANILAEMSPADARVLHAVYQWMYVQNNSTEMQLGELSAAVPLELSDTLLSLNNLTRLGLVTNSFNEYFLHGVKTNEEMTRLFARAGAKLTMFGASFLAVCMPAAPMSFPK